MCELQRKEDHEVTVHGLFGGGPLVPSFERLGVRFISHASVPKYLQPVKLFWEFLRDRPEVVHFHNVAPTVHGAMGAWLAGIPAIVSTRHGASSHSARREKKFWFAARFIHRVAVTSELARRDFLTDPWTDASKLFPIHNGAVLRSSDSADEGVEKFEFPDPGVTLVAVGRMRAVKDFHTMIRAVAIARKTVPQIRLWISGDGVERPALESLIQELELDSAVRLLGMREDVGYWLSRSDIFVLSSKSEGIPVSLLESMAWGLPSVVTEVGGVPEVMALSKAGVMVPPSNPEAMAAAMVELANDPARRRALGEAGQRCYRDHFTIAETTRRYQALYEWCRNGCPATEPVDLEAGVTQ